MFQKKLWIGGKKKLSLVILFKEQLFSISLPNLLAFSFTTVPCNILKLPREVSCKCNFKFYATNSRHSLHTILDILACCKLCSIEENFASTPTWFWMTAVGSPFHGGTADFFCWSVGWVLNFLCLKVKYTTIGSQVCARSVSSSGTRARSSTIILIFDVDTQLTDDMGNKGQSYFVGGSLFWFYSHV